uniref:Uncharacterized protein n=1 Tax=Macrostomum lignano TaxID=282301 RepID=A0A1I8JSD2_9PLAT
MSDNFFVYRQRSRSVTLAPAPSSTPEVDAVVATPTVLTMPTAARRRSMDDHSLQFATDSIGSCAASSPGRSVAAAETGQQTRRRCSLFDDTESDWKSANSASFCCDGCLPAADEAAAGI